MLKNHLLGSWIRRFLMEHLIGERGLARNTQANYRDSLALLLPFAAKKTRTSVDQLAVEDLSADLVRLFLGHLEKDRGCSSATRNQRLAAIHALAKFIALHSPEHIAWCTSIRAVPFKRTPKPAVPYLENAEMKAVLNAPNPDRALGRRDYAILLFLYNSGARADEAARATIAEITRGSSPSIKIVGKGNKERHCPLWQSTLKALDPLIAGRAADEPIFLGQRKEPMTRFGIHRLVARYASAAATRVPSLTKKRVSPHTIRHTTAVHLLRSGIDINTIRDWLGHVSIDTTNIYAQVDLERKAKALSSCEIQSSAKVKKHWNRDHGLMAFLRSL